MSRPRLEVADIFRGHGAAWRKANAGHVSLGELKVMAAIESCRTAALGGHVARCEKCPHSHIAYNSCLMGKIRYGESTIDLVSDLAAFRMVRWRFTLALLPIRLIGFQRRRPLSVLSSGLNGQRQEGMMLETYFVAPKTLRRLRTGPSGPHMDGFASSLEQDGFSHACALRYLRAAAHLGHFLHQQGRMLTETDSSTAVAFFHHFASCHCPHSNGGKRNHHTYFGAKRYREYLVQIGVCQDGAKSELPNPEPALVVGFRHWLRKHRGAADSTVQQYARGANELIKTLGNDPVWWTARDVRGYFVERIGQCGVGTAEKLVTSLRAFLRYLSVHGQCQADLHDAVPAFAAWRLAELPRYLTAEQVNRLIAACDGRSRERRRDRANVLLLVRLGLRAGDVARLRTADIEWSTGSVRVAGKGRYQVRLPLPQDVGDAIVDYLKFRPRIRNDDHIFVRNIAPYRPFLRGDGVSSVVRRAMKRAGVMTPAKGAHALRHTAATEMLRHGVPLDQIALVLRHRGIDTTAYYAKVDVNLLKQIAQPWPEVLP